MSAATAPRASSSSLRRPISGNRAMVTDSRSLCRDAGNPYGHCCSPDWLSRTALSCKFFRLVAFLFFVNAKFWYTQRVDTANPGLTSSTEQSVSGATGVRISPMPTASAAGASATKRHIRTQAQPEGREFAFRQAGVEQPVRNPFRVAAASLLPPPRPAATGMFLDRVISTPGSGPPNRCAAVCRNSSAAR